MVSRRGFLQRIASAVIGTIAAVYCPSSVANLFDKNPFAEESQLMVEPIRRALDYQRIGRRLLLVDKLPWEIEG